MKTLTYNQKFTIETRKCTVFTTTGYIKANPYPAHYNQEMYVEPAWEAPCGLKQASCLCGDPGYYEEEKKRWADAIELKQDELVKFDDEPGVWKTRFIGDFSDAVHFTKVSE